MMDIKEYLLNYIQEATAEFEKKKEKLLTKVPITSYVVQEYVIAKSRMETIREILDTIEWSERPTIDYDDNFDYDCTLTNEQILDYLREDEEQQQKIIEERLLTRSKRMKGEIKG